MIHSGSAAAFLLASLLPASVAAAQESRPKIEGRVLDENGAPLSGARVSIATARVRKGVSPY